MQNKLRVLYWDVETSPTKFWGWRTGKTYLSHDQIVKGQKLGIICICYKWAGEKEVYSLDWDVKKQDSSKMIEEFTKVVEVADIAIGHNSDKFDQRWVNTQRLINGQPPVAWPSSEDTLKQFRKHFFLPSYALDYISKLLTGSGKDKMIFDDWIQIVDNKDPKALAKMISYCKKDVLKLEEVYNKAKAFFSPKINASLIVNGDKSGCPRCGSLKTKSRGLKTLVAGRYRVRRCLVCLHSFRTNEKV